MIGDGMRARAVLFIHAPKPTNGINKCPRSGNNTGNPQASLNPRRHKIPWESANKDPCANQAQSKLRDNYPCRRIAHGSRWSTYNLASSRQSPKFPPEQTVDYFISRTVRPQVFGRRIDDLKN